MQCGKGGGEGGSDTISVQPWTSAVPCIEPQPSTSYSNKEKRKTINKCT